MNVLLIFFALPVATIILAIVLQKSLCNPLLVAATFFAIYLIVTFAAFDASFLVYAILYTLLAYVTAVLTRAICNLLRILTNRNHCTYRVTERPITFSNIAQPNSIASVENNSNIVSNDNLNNAEVTNVINSNNSNGYCNCRRR